MDLIFEIGCEDIPARFIEPALKEMRTSFVSACKDKRIAVSGVRTLATPRRLALLVEDIADAQADLEEVRTGPPARIAFDADGNPTKAALGFARGQGIDPEALYQLETPKGAVLAAKVFEKGEATAEILPSILEGILTGLNFPKSMRWADWRQTFARPVRWLLAVAGGQVVPVEFTSVTSSNVTFGHRFVSPGAIEIKSSADYEAALAAANVVADTDERRRRIQAGLAEVAQDAGGTLIDDPQLLDEVVYLVEDPYTVRVAFDEAYLELPDEVLISSMRSHQRYFSIADDQGKLVASCGVVYNTPVKDPSIVAAGNLRVLKARLDDAGFFWEQDLRQPLENFVDKLSDVVWLKQIGTMKARSARISMTAAHIAEAIGADETTVEDARRAGFLCKADLMTQMVYEFPDLQGVMGREYALRSKETEAVATAIVEQYLPGGASGDVPTTDAGACVALAEKLDAIVGCFGIGLIPTSAADPYALRRAALGVIRILQGRGYSLSLPQLVTLAQQTYQSLDPDVLKTTGVALQSEILEFIGKRLASQLSAEHASDIVAAVLAIGLDDVLSVTDRVEALAAIRDEPDFAPLAQGFKRVVNIIKKQAADFDATTPVDTALLVEDAEKALHTAYLGAHESMAGALESRDWPSACQTLIGLKAPVDAFFDHVMVMTDDADLKRNRLALLSGLERLFKQVADISVIS